MSGCTRININDEQTHTKTNRENEEKLKETNDIAHFSCHNNSKDWIRSFVAFYKHNHTHHKHINIHNIPLLLESQ